MQQINTVYAYSIAGGSGCRGLFADSRRRAGESARCADRALPGSRLALILAVRGLLRSPPDPISRAPGGAEVHRFAVWVRRWLLRSPAARGCRCRGWRGRTRRPCSWFFPGGGPPPEPSLSRRVAQSSPKATVQLRSGSSPGPFTAFRAAASVPAIAFGARRAPGPSRRLQEAGFPPTNAERREP